MRLACVSASLRMTAALRSLAAVSSSMRRSRFLCSAVLALSCSSCARLQSVARCAELEP